MFLYHVSYYSFGQILDSWFVTSKFSNIIYMEDKTTLFWKMKLYFHLHGKDIVELMGLGAIVSSRKHSYIILTPLNPTFI